MGDNKNISFKQQHNGLIFNTSEVIHAGEN
jgi:hypothetical protein